MGKRFFLIVFFCMFFLFNFVSSNFVCGEVFSSDSFESYWMDVMIYYDEKPDDFVFCKVNSQNKFCCDLDEINVSFLTGKRVWAEVYDLDSGFVSDKVFLHTTDEAYDVFPEIYISEAIVFNNDFKRVLVGIDSVSFNLSLDGRFNNLRVLVNNSDGLSEFDVCNECEDVLFDLNFVSGRNDVFFVAYGEREFFKNVSFFVLDFLDVNYDFECSGCRFSAGRFFVPANEVIKVSLEIVGSHDFEAEVYEFIPTNWVLIEDDFLTYFSGSHDFVRYEVSGDSFNVEYFVKSPNDFLQRRYFFNVDLEGNFFDFEVRLNRFFWFGLPIYFSRTFSNYSYYEESLMQFAGPKNPMVIHIDDSFVNLIAVYPTRQGVFRGNVGIKSPLFFGNWREYSVVSNFNNAHIERVVVQLKVEKDESVKVRQEEKIIDVEFFKEDGGFDYYIVYLNDLTKFVVEKV